MPFLDEIIDFSISPLVAFVMAFITFLFPSCMSMLLQMLFAPLFKLKVRLISLMGFRFEKQNNGKWESRGYKPMIGFTAEPVFDMERCAGMSPKQFRVKERQSLLTTGIIGLLIGAGVMTGCLFWAHNSSSEYFASLIRIFGFFWFCFALAMLILSVILLIRVSNKNSLGGYYQNAIGMIRAGIPYDQMDLKSVKELNLKKVMNSEKIMYFPIYFQYLDYCGLFDKMPEAVNEIESILTPQASSRSALFCMITLTYYYSYLCPNPVLATQYYQRSGDFLAKDTDSNGMRIKAFYELYCCRNVERAIDYAGKAYEGLEKFSIGSEKEYERVCIARLNEAIRQFQSQQPGY